MIFYINCGNKQFTPHSTTFSAAIVITGCGCDIFRTGGGRGGRLSKREEMGGRSEKSLRTARLTDDQKRCCERPGRETIRKGAADGRGDILYTIHDDLFHAYGARCEIGLFSDSAPENRYSGCENQI